MLDGQLEIHTLLCRAHVPFAIHCLTSLVKAHVDPVSLVVHDDGSLRDEEMRQFSHLSPRWIMRPEADEKLDELLAKLPLCRAFRKTNPMALKLLDVALLSDGQYLNYCDSDVLFFKKVRLFFAPPTGSDGVFTMDTVQGFSIRAAELMRSGMSLISKLNAGTFSVKRNVLDLEKIEWCLGQPFARRHEHVAEQTLWSLLVGSLRINQWDPRQFKIINSADDVEDELVAGHFISTNRQCITQFFDRAQRLDGEPIVVKQRRGRRLTGIALAAIGVSERMKRLLPAAKAP